jgi:hypothetical protein
MTVQRTGLTLVESYRGHVEYEEGHVHFLPLSHVWNVVCHACPGDVQFARSGRTQTTTRLAGIDWLRAHVAACPNRNSNREQRA